jgi:hypothetical protein
MSVFEFWGFYYHIFVACSRSPSSTLFVFPFSCKKLLLGGHKEVRSIFFANKELTGNVNNSNNNNNDFEY